MWGGPAGLPREGVGVEKFVPSLKSLFLLGFDGGNLGKSWEILPGYPGPLGCSLLCSKKKKCSHLLALSKDSGMMMD